MRLTEAKWGYLSRCMAVCLVLWLSLAAARGVEAAPITGNCPPTATNAGPALSADNTIYTLYTSCSTRFWRAGTIVVAASTPTGQTLSVNQRQQEVLAEAITDRIQTILGQELILAQSMKGVRVFPLFQQGFEDNNFLEVTHNNSSSIVIGSAIAVFLVLEIGPRQPIGDSNLVKAVNTINSSPLNKEPILPHSNAPQNTQAVFIRRASPDCLRSG